MPATNLAVVAFLSAWASLVASVPVGNGETKGNYTVCKTEVCQQRAKLINESIDECVDPCQDFYSYACGGWIKRHNISESKSRTGTFSLLRDELRETLKSILENMTLVYESQNITDKAAVAYNACMAVPELGEQPDLIRAIMNLSGLTHWPITNDTEEMFENCTEVLNKTTIFTVLSVTVDRDIKNLNSNIIGLDQIGFSPVGRNELIHPEEERNKKIIDAYKKLIQSALRFMKPNLSEDELSNISDTLVNFEGQLANLTDPPEERRDLLKIYYRTTIGELQKNFTHVPLLSSLRKEFSKANITLNESETVELYALNYYERLNLFLQCADSKTLYNYAGLQVMKAWAAQASEQYRNASFELSQAISGVVADSPRWEKCVDTVNNMMPEIVGHLYVHHKFSKEAKEEVEDLARRLVEVFNETLQKAKWMDNQTRNAAEDKLAKMGRKIGYPEWLYNTTYLEQLYQYVPELCQNCSFGQILVWIVRNNWMHQMLKLRLPYDKDAWIIGPAIVNAFYSPTNNEMVYPSGILQGVFYQHGLPRSLNFGAIGMVVGHEMTHGFDDTGSQFDAEGALKQWWTNTTRKHFEEKAKCFEDQYGNITDKAANMSLNGKNTVGENIADNGGLRMAFKAYNRMLRDECENNDTRLPGLEHLSGKKLFFLSNAMVWCSNIRLGYLRQQIQYDPHSPAQYRVNVPMSNMQAFSTIFKCSANSTMNATKRCTLW